MSYTISHQTPSDGYIAWSGVHIVFDGVDNAITDGNTNKIYVYWVKSSPNTLQTSNDYPSLGSDDCIVFINRSGVAVSVLDSSVTDGGLIVPSTVTAVAIAAGAVTADHIKAGAITADHISSHTITGDNLMINAIEAMHITAGAIEADHVSAGAITADAIAANAVTTAAIAAGAVSADEIAANAITTGKISA